MKPWTLVPISVLVSLVTSFLVVTLAGSSSAAETRDDGGLAERLGRMQEALDSLATQQGELARAVAERAPRQVEAAAPPRVPVDEIDRAVARWMEENAARLAPEEASTRGAVGSAAPALLAGIEHADVSDLIAALIHDGELDFQNNELWQALRDSGRIDDVLAEFERMAREDPTNPDLQVAVGGAYLQKLFGVGNSPLAGELASKADAAFDRALELDETHWGARFTKAVSLSNWPAFLGKSGEAIRQFEILLEQQAQQAPQPRFAQTYLFLGNMYLQTGKSDLALKTWREGLAAYPDSEFLLEQIASNSR